MPQIYGTQHGLSTTKIASITQDNRGFIWIASENGLNRFDGYNFTVYKKMEGDSSSLMNNHIAALWVDSDNRLWIASMSGLQYYDPYQNNFVTEQLGQAPALINNKKFGAIMEDSRRNLWFSVYDIGIIKYSLETKQSVLYMPNNEENAVCSKSIGSIEEDSEGNIWFASMDNGISVYLPENDSFVHYHSKNSRLPVNEILNICRMGNGNMLIATINKGLYIFNKDTREFKFTGNHSTSFCLHRLQNQSVLIGTEGEGLLYMDPFGDEIRVHPAITDQMYEIKNSKIHYVFEDNNGSLWIGMFNNGICQLRKEPDGFKNFKNIRNNNNSLNNGQITSITTDKEGNYWFATDGGGLNFQDRYTGKYVHYQPNPNDIHSIPDDAVVSVFCDSQGTIWAGTYSGGLCKFDKQKNHFTRYKHSDFSNSLPGNYVKCIVEDQAHNLWLGTDGNGISRFSPESGKFVNYSNPDYPELTSNNTTCLFIDKNNILWIGTFSGLSSFDIDNQIFKTYTNDVSPNQTIYSIAEDENLNLWVGTSYGLKKYNPEKDAFQNYVISERYKDTFINGIIPYKQNLWLSTIDGIICYSTINKQVIYFIANNDLSGANFLRSSYYLSPENEIFLGSNQGCYSFFPDKLHLEGYSPKIYLTNLKIYNKTVNVGQMYDGRVILDKSLDNLKKIVLKYSENNFALEFSAPNNLYPYSITYSYFMEGIDKEWVSLANTQQNVSYANLAPGVYTFKIQATNIPDRFAGEYTSLSIEILPPFWLSWWAELGYFLFGFIVLFLILNYIYIKVRDRNNLRMEQLKAKKQEELNESKMQFFTNISHEFRTPLTLIMAPLEEMQQTELNPERAQIMKIMSRNANHLLRLINQILDLRKTEANKIQIKACPINLVVFIEDFLELFTDMANRNVVSVDFIYPSYEALVWFDPDLLEKCLYNLLFNALKFTPKEGTIQIEIVQKSNEETILSIRDNGIGIAEKEIPHLFDRFYQGEFSKKSGTGIGLHLVKTIIELHRGTIDVESEKGKGSCFNMHIKTGKDHFNPDEYTDIPWKIIPAKEIPISKTKNPDVEITDHHKSTILLVEDDEDMRTYICYELKKTYQIIEARNGREAIFILRSKEPELIITDVMMPELNGIELCKLVKENAETCHIPVIMLTANSDMEHRLEGLETGADSYITKPFHASHLMTQIKKLMEKHEKLRRKFNKFLNMDALKMEIVNPDEVLLQNTIDFIHSNISDTELTVEKIAKSLNTSRTNLHRKIKLQTGLSPIELIKAIRMKQAAYLLEKKTLTISEIAYELGYSSLAYFSTSFNSYWGTSPSTFKVQI
ncbi:hybrid sensor histidine kinase/response regulator [Bacteroidia bacterium]|nr:hybrid sensor histidine kinase/response regulator [Bacteroidia bacterium]